MENILNEINITKIAPQRFNRAIVITLACVLLSYAYYFLDKGIRYFVFTAMMILSIEVLSAFKKYLENFDSVQANRWIKLLINGYIFMSVAFVISYVCSRLPALRHMLVLLDFLRVFLSFFLLISICGYLFSVCAAIALGNALQKIKNDPTGLMNVLGTMLSYSTATLGICLVVILYFKNLRVSYLAESSLWLRLAVQTIAILPYLVIAVIFHKSNKLSRK